MSSTVPISQEKILFPEGCAWIDGKYVSINTAAVPITDFGFSRSDCTYDVVGVWDGKFFRIDDHVERFKRSCRIDSTFSSINWRIKANPCTSLVKATGLKNSYVESIMTRGIPGPGEKSK